MSHKRLSIIDAASLAGVAGMAALAAAVWKFGRAGPLPVHFDIHGDIDRYGSRQELALGIAFMAAASALLLAITALLGRAGKGAGWAETLRLARGLTVLAMGFGALTLAGIALGWADRLGGPQRGSMMGLGLLFLIIGAVIGKVRPNPIAGVRTYWTRHSRLAWDKSNRLAGRLFAVIGAIALLASPFAPMPAGLAALTAAVLVAAAWSVLESYLVWRKDPDRKARV